MHATRSARLRASNLEALCALVSDAALEVASAEEAIRASDPLDPFASPRATRVTVAFTGALLDPFTVFGGAMRVLGSPDVVDPWP